MKELYPLFGIVTVLNQHLGISIHFFKRLLNLQGIYPTARVREPILPFDNFHGQIADKLIENIIELELELKLTREMIPDQY